jgi:hypothetical protein
MVHPLSSEKEIEYTLENFKNMFFTNDNFKVIESNEYSDDFWYGI